jgi:hypothetical protein
MRRPAAPIKMEGRHKTELQQYKREEEEGKHPKLPVDQLQQQQL